MRDEDFSYKITANVTFGEDDNGVYLEELLYTGGAVRRYYELIEKLYLENMPDDVLEDLIEQLKGEKNRRLVLKELHIKEIK